MLVLFVAASPITPPARAAREALVVIVSDQLAQDSISLAELRRCFLGLSANLGGARLVPINHPPSSDPRLRFDDAILDMSTQATQRFWIDSLIRGGKRAPRTVSDGRLLLKVVAKLVGAISYLDDSAAVDAPGVKVLAIDGVASSAPSYPLR